MKKLLFIALISSSLFWSGCDNGNEITNGFEMEYIEDFTIFAGLNTIETHVFEFDITSNFQNYLNLHGYTAADIQTIVPKFIRMSNLNGNQTYDILQRARLFVGKTDGSLNFETAFSDPVPSNTGYELPMNPTLVTVTDQLQEDQFKAQMKLNFLTIPPQSIDTRLTMTFQVVINE